jgi:mannose-1-phosphate guanylyltransferase
MNDKKGKLICDAGKYADSRSKSAEGGGPPSLIGLRDRLWSIILAGGNGERISADIHRWMGRPVPKQYCAFVGKRSMLQHTVARADALGARDRLLTVVARSHREAAESQLADRSPKSIILQPKNCDTFAGIFLPLTYVYARNPEAIAVIYPSDHFIYPENAFVEMIANAIQAAEALPDKLILVGVPAESIDQDYGWILPGSELWQSGLCLIRAVQLFLEKPSHQDAAAIRASGGLWNTMIISVQASALWRLGWDHFPEIMESFDQLRDAIDSPYEDLVLNTIYESMPKRNFSSDLLTHVTDHVAVLAMEDVLWSDWGRMERIIETLNRVGKRPNFPTLMQAGHNLSGASDIELKIS